LQHVKKAGERAKGLVSQMLAFSRDEARDDRPLQLQSLLVEDIRMLRSTLPASIEISTEIDADLPPVMMDQVQFNQIMMNLCINARDAMKGKGTITVGLGWARGTDAECTVCRKLVRGDWIELSVTDTGSGIKPGVLERIFDPFFTTKDVGKGTGMGLSVTHGIIHSHEGHIMVNTEVGIGSTFRLLFPPIAEATAETEEAGQLSSESPSGQGEHLLVLDDEPDLGEYLGDLLETFGYLTTVMSDSKEALELFQQDPDKFDLIITDQTMPGMTGIEVVNAVRQIRPDMPVILDTGFSDDIDAEAAAKMDIHFLEKPVSTHKLLQMVEGLLRSAK
ncbi:MAG: response regulator, partial [Gammaproteobacteria bacterium]|nr:response regulator [Gammaproteobacteria bacterium]